MRAELWALIHCVVMALPLAMLKGLQMSTNAKLGLACIFCCGIITIAFDVVRSVETLTHSSSGGSTTLWTNLESAIAVIVSCLPTFKALLGPRKGGRSGPSANSYGQRPWPRSDSGQIQLTSRTSSKGGMESFYIANQSCDNSIRGASIDIRS